MNKELLRMQQLAGLITESELKGKLSLNEGLDAKTKKYLYNTAGGFLDSTYFDDVKVGDELKFTFNAVDDEADLRTGPDFAKIGDKFVTFEEDGDTKYEVKKAGGDNYEIKITIKKEVE